MTPDVEPLVGRLGIDSQGAAKRLRDCYGGYH